MHASASLNATVSHVVLMVLVRHDTYSWTSGACLRGMASHVPVKKKPEMQPKPQAGATADRSLLDLLGGVAEARGGASLLDDGFGLGDVGVGGGRLFSGKDDIEVGLLEDRDQHFGEFPASSCALHVGRTLEEELCLMFVALSVCAEARGWTENDAWYLIFGRRSSQQIELCRVVEKCGLQLTLAC